MQQSVWMADLINIDEFVSESRTNVKKDDFSFFLHKYISVFVYYELILFQYFSHHIICIFFLGLFWMLL